MELVLQYCYNCQLIEFYLPIDVVPFLLVALCIIGYTIHTMTRSSFGTRNQ